MSNGPGREIGVFGGTFDPPHVGHLAIALEVRHVLDLDEVWFVVAGDPAEVRGTLDHAGIDPPRHGRGGCGEVDGVQVSSLEIDRDGPSYTADTLTDLAAAHPADTFHLIIGSDAAVGLDTWHRPDVVAELAKVVVVDRGGREGGRPPAGWSYELVDVPALEVSSSDLRRRVADGAPIRGLVSPGVADVIEAHDLYRESS